MADGWIADPVQSLPVIKEFAERYRTEAAKIGRTPYICLMRDAVIAESLEKAAAESAPTMVTHRFYFKYGAYVPDEYLRHVKDVDDLTFDVEKGAASQDVTDWSEESAAQTPEPTAAR